MTPEKTDNQNKLFEPLLEPILNDKHPLYKLAASINWETIEKELVQCPAKCAQDIASLPILLKKVFGKEA